MEYTREQLMQALRAADAAGDTAAATAIAKRISGLQSAPSPQVAPQVQAPANGASQAPSDASERPFERAGGYGPVLAGVADFGIKSYLGLKGLIPGIGNSEQDKAILRELNAEADADPEGGWRTAGEMGAGVLATAVPGAQAARALPMTFAGKAAPALSAAASSGLVDFAITPGDMGDKAKAAGLSAALGGTMSAVRGLFGKAATQPFKPTREAQSLLDEGIVPTLQQGAEGRMGRALGSLTEGIVDPADRQNREVTAAFIKRISPGADLSDLRPHEQVGVLRDNFAREYQDVFAGKTFTAGSQERSAMKAALKTPDAHGESMVKAKGRFNGVFPRTLGPTKDMSPEQMQKYYNILQDRIEKIGGKDTTSLEARQLLEHARDIYANGVRKQGLSPEELARLDDIDSRMGDFMRFQRAATKSAPHKKGVVRAADILDEYASMDHTGIPFATAQNKTQRELLIPATETLGLTGSGNEANALANSLRRIRQLGSAIGMGAATMANPVLATPWAVSAAGQTKAGARFMFGDYDSQKVLARALRKAEPYMAAGGAAIPIEE